MTGRVEAIFLTAEHGELPAPVERVRNRCGLNADILTDGEISIGDPVTVV